MTHIAALEGHLPYWQYEFNNETRPVPEVANPATNADPYLTVSN